MKFTGSHRPRLGLDIDGCVGDCGTHLVNYNKRRGVIPAEDVVNTSKSRYLEAQYPGMIFPWVTGDDAFWADVPLMEGALDFVAALKLFFEIDVVSACSGYEERTQWLRTHKIAESYYNIRAGDKADFFKVMAYDAIIEDTPETLIAACSTVPFVFGVAQGYNHDLHGKATNLWVGNYLDILRWIERLGFPCANPDTLSELRGRLSARGI